MVPYRGVIFDLYGTLIDGWTQRDSRHRGRELARALGAPQDAFSQVLETTYTERATGALGGVAEMLLHLSGLIGHHPTDGELERAVELRVEQFREVLSQPREETSSVLASLRDRGVRVGLITDCSAETPHLWGELHWNAPIQEPLFSWTERRRKPDPRLYLKALQLLDLGPDQCLYVGDGGSRELTGALQVGIEARRVAFHDHRPERHLQYDPDAEWSGPSVSTLSELLPLFER